MRTIAETGTMQAEFQLKLWQSVFLIGLISRRVEHPTILRCTRLSQSNSSRMQKTLHLFQKQVSQPLEGVHRLRRQERSLFSQSLERLRPWEGTIPAEAEI